MFRSESWPSWVIGLVSGAAAGFLVLLGGAPFLALSVLFLALAFVAARSLAFVSGMFVGLGGLWCALVVRAQLACDAFDAAPRQDCQGYGVGQFLAVSIIVIGIGAVVGFVALRHRAQRTSP
jgi:hypothetical protein